MRLRWSMKFGRLIVYTYYRDLQICIRNILYVIHKKILNAYPANAFIVYLNHIRGLSKSKVFNEYGVLFEKKNFEAIARHLAIRYLVLKYAILPFAYIFFLNIFCIDGQPS